MSKVPPDPSPSLRLCRILNVYQHDLSYLGYAIFTEKDLILTQAGLEVLNEVDLIIEKYKRKNPKFKDLQS